MPPSTGLLLEQVHDRVSERPHNKPQYGEVMHHSCCRIRCCPTVVVVVIVAAAAAAVVVVYVVVSSFPPL